MKPTHNKRLFILFLTLSSLLIGYYLFFEGLDENKVIKEAIKYHNSSVEKISKIDFPIMESGQTVTREVHIGGPPGNRTILEMSAFVDTENNIYCYFI